MLNNTIVLLSLWLLMPMAQAQQCFEPSPNFMALGDAYFNINDAEELNGENPAVQFLQTLEDEWRGSVDEIECYGSDENPRLEERKADVTADISQSSSALLVADLTKTYRHGTVSGDKVFLLDKTSVFNMQALKNEVRATERLRRVWANSGSQLIEIFSTIRLVTDDQLFIDWQMYSNGVFVFSQTMDLQRD